jgi:hypothetical protein
VACHSLYRSYRPNEVRTHHRSELFRRASKIFLWEQTCFCVDNRNLTQAWPDETSKKEVGGTPPCRIQYLFYISEVLNGRTVFHRNLLIFFYVVAYIVVPEGPIIEKFCYLFPRVLPSFTGPSWYIYTVYIRTLQVRYTGMYSTVSALPEVLCRTLFFLQVL